MRKKRYGGEPGKGNGEIGKSNVVEKGRGITKGKKRGGEEQRKRGEGGYVR